MFDLLKTINPKAMTATKTADAKATSNLEGATGEFNMFLNDSTNALNEKSKSASNENILDLLTSKFQNKPEARNAKVGQDDLFKIFSSNESPEVQINQLNDLLASGQISEADLEEVDLSNVDPKLLESILGNSNPLKDDLKTTGPLNLNLSDLKNTNITKDNQILTQKQFRVENGLIVNDVNANQDAQDNSLTASQQKLDHRLMQPLSTLKVGDKNSAQAITNTSVNYSEDFLNQRMSQGLNQKPQIISKSNAFNVFKKEQSLMEDTGIIKNKAFTDMSHVKTNFNSELPQKLNIEQDSKTQNEELTIDPSQIDSKTNMPKTEHFLSQANSSSETKVIDLNNVQSKEQIISEITKYIEHSKIQNGRELDVLVSHKDLGQFRIHAGKSSSGELIDLKIMTSSAEGQNFFNQNEVNLLKSLNNNGVKVSDIRISMLDTGAMSSNTNSGNDSAGQNNSGNAQGFARNYSGGSDFHNQGKQRRQELWENYREQMGA